MESGIRRIRGVFGHQGGRDLTWAIQPPFSRQALYFSSSLSGVWNFCCKSSWRAVLSKLVHRRRLGSLEQLKGSEKYRNIKPHTCIHVQRLSARFCSSIVSCSKSVASKYSDFHTTTSKRKIVNLRPISRIPWFFEDAGS